jgi:hypothetical protein
VVPIFGPYLPVVDFHNGARDGQSHAHAFGLAGEERCEDFIEFVFGNAGAAIRDRHLGEVIDARSPNADDAIFGRDLLHRIDPVRDEVQNDLLKLNAIAKDHKRLRRDPNVHFDLSSHRTYKFGGISYEFIEVEAFQFNEAAQSLNDFAWRAGRRAKYRPQYP